MKEMMGRMSARNKRNGTRPFDVDRFRAQIQDGRGLGLVLSPKKMIDSFLHFFLPMSRGRT
jgi:hypothetical protein